MPPLSEEQIEQMFRDFGLGAEADRQRFRTLGITPGDSRPTYTFIRLSDNSPGHESGEENAKLARAP